MGSKKSERRRAARLEIVLEVKYKIINMEGSPVKITKSGNMSMTGILIFVEEILCRGDLLHLEIYLPGDKIPIVVKGIVAWQQEVSGEKRTGILFQDMKKEDCKRFADYCFRKMYEMVGLKK